MKNKVGSPVLLSCLVLLSAGNTLAQASNCEPVNIDIERLGPVRDQAIAGLCFAFESADLVSYKFGHRVSALDMAMSYYGKTRLQKFTSVYKTGGDSETTLAGANPTGFCSEEEVPSDEQLIGTKETPKTYSNFEWLEKNSWAKAEAYSRAAEIFPNLTEVDFNKAGKIKNFKERMRFLQKSACRNRINEKVALTLVSADKKTEVPELIKIIDQQLNANNVVGIGFHSNDLYSNESRNDDDNHATTLVARRWNSSKNTCEYMMRDNFGTKCEVYQKHFECEGGYIWISEAFLLKNLYEVEYLK